MAWFTYMVVTSKGKIYTGISTDPSRRVYEHNYTKKGSKILRGQRPVKLVWLREMCSKSDALSYERLLKQKSRLGKLYSILDGCQISHEELDELLWPRGN